MSQELQISSSIQKPEEFELFAQWLKYKRLVKITDCDIEELEDKSILSLNTMTEFAEKYGVTLSQLSRWKRRPEVVEYLRDSINSFFAESFSEQIKKAFIDKVKSDPSATNFMTYVKVFEGYREKSDQKHTVQTEQATPETLEWEITKQRTDE